MEPPRFDGQTPRLSLAVTGKVEHCMRMGDITADYARCNPLTPGYGGRSWSFTAPSDGDRQRSDHGTFHLFLKGPAKNADLEEGAQWAVVENFLLAFSFLSRFPFDFEPRTCRWDGLPPTHMGVTTQYLPNERSRAALDQLAEGKMLDPTTRTLLALFRAQLRLAGRQRVPILATILEYAAPKRQTDASMAAVVARIKPRLDELVADLDPAEAIRARSVLSGLKTESMTANLSRFIAELVPGTSRQAATRALKVRGELVHAPDDVTADDVHEAEQVLHHAVDALIGQRLWTALGGPTP